MVSPFAIHCAVADSIPLTDDRVRKIDSSDSD